MHTKTIRHRCPHCAERLETVEAMAGRGFECPNCDGNLTVLTQHALMTMARPVVVPEVIPMDGDGGLDLSEVRVYRRDDDKPVEMRLGKIVGMKVDVDKKTRNVMATTFLGGLLVALGAVIFSMFGRKSKA
jgi:hypothetical protein